MAKHLATVQLVVEAETPEKAATVVSLAQEAARQAGLNPELTSYVVTDHGMEGPAGIPVIMPPEPGMN